MTDKHVNKVVIGGETKIDLTGDTIVANKLLSGYTAHDASGAPIEGSCTFDSDTSNDDAIIAEVLNGKTFHARGAALVGSMTNNGGVTGTISSKSEQYTVPVGYHDGSGKVSIDSSEQAKLQSTNIRQGVTILGVEGSMTGTEDVHAQTISVTPSFSAQTIVPGSGYNYLNEVDVAAIPVTYADNAAGGQTATVG